LIQGVQRQSANLRYAEESAPVGLPYMAAELLRIMNTVSVVVVLACTWSTATAVSEDCDAEGTCKASAPQPRVLEASMPTAATFSNAADVEVDVLWIDEGKEIKIITLPAGDTQSLNTFTGHRFAMRGKGAEAKFVVVSKAKKKFTFGGPDGVMPGAERLEGTTALPVKLRNKCNRDFQMWFESDPGSVGDRLASISPGEQEDTTSYPGHVFCFSKLNDEQGCRNAEFKITIKSGTSFYAVDDGTGTEKIKSKWDAQDAFNKEYKAKAGRDWISFWPRDPVKQHFHPAEKVGDEIRINTSVPPQHAGGAGTEPGVLTLKVLSLQPRAFLVPNFLTDEEANHIVSLGSKRVKRSKTGSFGKAQDSETRTSRNTWIESTESEISARLYRRAAELANVTEKVGFEDLQLVHYGVGHHYAPHYDWQATHTGSRYATLLLYLNDPLDGGATSFPLAVPPMKVHPGKGSAVMFYNLLPDGNADIHALHSGMPVEEGEKWLANFWMWDPPESKAKKRDR